MDNHSMFKRFAVSGGMHVAADLSGDPTAPPVILLHGGGQTRHSWHGASAELVRCGYHVLNLDARGHGDSDWSPQGDYGLEAQAADLQGVTNTLSQPPALVGASMGAATALYAAGNFGSGFARALVLVDFVPDVEAAGAQKILSFMNANLGGFASVAEAADAVSAYYPHRTRPSDYSGLKKNLRLRADGRWYWHWDPRFVNSPVRGEPPQFGAKLSDAAQRVRIPTLLVRGLLSDIVSDRGIANLRANLPALELFDVAGAAHMVAGDKNDSFNQGVIAFLQRQLTPEHHAPV
jgi:pimeloyl-ACP methyl ester carboxylesterase